MHSHPAGSCAPLCAAAPGVIASGACASRRILGVRTVPSGCILALHSPFQRYGGSGGCALAPCRLLCPAVRSGAGRNSQRRLCIALDPWRGGLNREGVYSHSTAPSSVAVSRVGVYSHPVALGGGNFHHGSCGDCPFCGVCVMVWLRVAGALGVANPLHTARSLPVRTRRSAGVPLLGRQLYPLGCVQVGTTTLDIRADQALFWGNDPPSEVFFFSGCGDVALWATLLMAEGTLASILPRRFRGIVGVHTGNFKG